jgi:hypothetical protein
MGDGNKFFFEMYNHKPVGYWVLYPGAILTTKFAMYARPTDEQIANTKFVLGWGWEDEPKDGAK